MPGFERNESLKHVIMKKYKQLLMSVAVCLLPAMSHGRGDVVHTRLKTLYSNAGILAVDKVVLADTATVVHFTAKGKPNSSFLFASTTYLSDEDAVRYPLEGASGLTIGENCVIPRSGETEFRLVFAPMPKDTRIFDLVEGAGQEMFRLLGIHGGKSKVEIPVAKEEIDAGDVAEDMFRGGKAVVRGKIEDYTRDWNSSLWVFDIARMGQGLKEPFFLSQPHAAIRTDGTFCAELALDHPVWGFVGDRSGDVNIPFYVRPGDTLTLTITGLGTDDMRVEYAGSNPKGCLVHLMQHQDVPLVAYGWEELQQYVKDENADNFLEKVDESVEKSMRLCDYVAWKYKFTPWETHLLKNRQRMELVDRYLFLGSRWFGERVDYPKGLGGKEDFTGYDFSVYKSLALLPADDPSLSFLPYSWGYPSTLPTLYPLSFASSYVFEEERAGGERASGSWNRVAMEKKEDSLHVKVLRELLGTEGTPWLVQAYLTQQVTAKDVLTPAERKEVVEALDAYLTHPFFRKKARELDKLVSHSKSNMYAVPFADEKERRRLESILEDYEGQYVHVVWFSTPEKYDEFCRDESVSNLLEDYEGNGMRLLAVVNGGDGPGWTEATMDYAGVEFPERRVVKGDDYLPLQEALGIGSMAQITFDRNGLVFKQSLDMRNETKFRRRVRDILKAEEGLNKKMTF